MAGRSSDKAIAVAASKTNSIVTDYTAAPVFFTNESNGAHEWLIEFEKRTSKPGAIYTGTGYGIKKYKQ